jgi:hypothetical protein
MGAFYGLATVERGEVEQVGGLHRDAECGPGSPGVLGEAVSGFGRDLESMFRS